VKHILPSEMKFITVEQLSTVTAMYNYSKVERFIFNFHIEIHFKKSNFFVWLTIFIDVVGNITMVYLL